MHSVNGQGGADRIRGGQGNDTLNGLAGPDRLRPFLDEKDTVELTDDHVPVDQLLAPVFGDSLEQQAEEGAVAE